MFTVGSLLETVGPAIAEGIGAVLGKEAIVAWRKQRWITTASRKALTSTTKRFNGWPGAKRDLKAWAKSDAFDNLLLDAALGNTEALTATRIVESFVNSGGGVGWGKARSERAKALTSVFLNHLFDEFARGPEGQVFAVRLTEARENPAREGGPAHPGIRPLSCRDGYSRW